MPVFLLQCWIYFNTPPRTGRNATNEFDRYTYFISIHLPARGGIANNDKKIHSSITLFVIIRQKNNYKSNSFPIIIVKITQKSILTSTRIYV